MKNRGANDQAQEYLLRYARARQYRKYNSVLACQILRDLKIPVPQSNGVDVSDEDAGNEASGSRGAACDPLDRDALVDLGAAEALKRRLYFSRKLCSTHLRRGRYGMSSL